MVTANFAGDAQHDLLLFEPKGRTIDIYRSDPAGKLTLLKTTSTRQPWTHILAGGFGSRPFHNLFFYNAQQGTGEFYASDGQGGLEKVGANTGLRKGCTQVVNGDFGGSATADLMFYDPSAGEAVFYTVDEYVMTELHTQTGWRKTWTTIGSSKWSNNPWHSLIFYDASAGEILLAETDGTGRLGAQRTHSGLPKDWTILGGMAPVDNAPVPHKGLVTGYNAQPAPEAPPATPAPVALSRMDFFASDANARLACYDSRNGVYPAYTHLATGAFGVSGGADIFCYDSGTGQGDIWTRTDQGGLLWAVSVTSLRKGCTLMVSANMAGDANRDLMFYEPTEGTIDVHRVDAPGKLTLLKTTTGVRKTWTHVTIGAFGSRPYHNLFFYDAAAGVGEFYAADGKGGLNKVGEHTGLRKGCTQVVSGSFGGSTTADLILYDPVAGEGVFYTVDEYQITELRVTPNWRKTFSHIGTGKWSNTPWSDLVFYDPTRGQIVIHTTDGQGNTSLLSANDGLPTDWTLIGHAGAFKGGPDSPTKGDLVCYRWTIGDGLTPGSKPGAPAIVASTAPPAPKFPTTGRMAVFSLERGVLSQITTHQGLRAWTHVVAGDFAPGTDGNANPYGDLFCYDSKTGDAETVKVGKTGALTTIDSFTGLPTGAEPVAFQLTGSRRLILMYNAKADIGIYDAADRMRLVKSYPKWGKTWSVILPSNIMVMGETADFLFYNKDNGRGEIWSINKKTLELKLQRAYDWEGHWDAVATGWFIRTTGDCILGIMNAYAVGNVQRCTGAANYLPATAISVPRETWSKVVKIKIGGDYDSMVLYSAAKSRAEVRQITSDASKNVWSVKDGVGRWSAVVPMPYAGITQRIVFYSPDAS